MKTIFLTFCSLLFCNLVFADITEVLDKAILSDAKGDSCAIYLSADENSHAGYNLYAVLPPSEVEDGKYDCDNGKYRACVGQKLTYAYCYINGECNVDFGNTIITFNGNDFSNFKNATTGNSLNYHSNVSPRTCSN